MGWKDEVRGQRSNREGSGQGQWEWGIAGSHVKEFGVRGQRSKQSAGVTGSKGVGSAKVGVAKRCEGAWPKEMGQRRESRPPSWKDPAVPQSTLGTAMRAGPSPAARHFGSIPPPL